MRTKIGNYFGGTCLMRDRIVPFQNQMLAEFFQCCSMRDFP